MKRPWELDENSYTKAEESVILSEEMNFETLQKNGVKMSNTAARKWYVIHDKNIHNEVDKTLPLEERARQAFELRNKYRTQSRELMADKAARAKLDKNEPNKTFEQLLKHKIVKYGFSREQAIQDIYRTATKSNENVNKLFGME